MQGVLVPRSELFDQAQAAVEAAARDFAQPDPSIRARGERVFLAVRQAEQAVDYACYFLANSSDAFVLFQSLGMILATLPGVQPDAAYPVSAYVPSLLTLCDFVAQVAIQRSSASPSSTLVPWPAYVQRQAFQTIAAVGKKALAVDLALASQQTPPASLTSVAEQHATHLNNLLSSLLQPSSSETPSADMVWLGLGLVYATLDEYSLATAATVDADTPDRGDTEKGKARAVEKGSSVGLTASLHLLCKAVFQCYSYAHCLPLVLNQVKNHIDSFSAEKAPVLASALAALENLLGWAFLQDDVLRITEERVQSTFTADRLDAGTLTLDDHLLASNLSKQTASTSDTSVPEASQVPVVSTTNVAISNVAPEILFASDLLSLLAETYRLILLRSASSGTGGAPAETILHRSKMCILLAQALVPVVLDAHPSTSATQHLGLHQRLETQLTLWTKQVEPVDADGLSVSALPGLSVAQDADQYGAHLLFLVRMALVFVRLSPTGLLSATLAPVSGSTEHLCALLQSLAHLSRAVFAYAFGSDSLAITAQGDREQADAQREEVLNQLIATWSSLDVDLSQEATKLTASEDPDDPFRLAPIPSQGASASAHVLQQALKTVHTVLHTDVVQPYVLGRLSSSAVNASLDAHDGMSEQGDETTKDRELYAEQLTSIGLLARCNAVSSLTLLAEYFQGCLAALDGAQAGQDLNSTWEQLNWLLLITGHFLADAGQGETPVPPVEISEQLSGAQSLDNEQQAATGQAALGTLLAEVGTTRLLALTQRHEGDVSPLVLETWLWFTGRWATAYMFSSIAGGALTADAGASTLRSLIQAISLAIRTWSSDADVVTEAAACIKSFQLSEALPGKFLADESSSHALFTAILNSLPNLPAGTHGKLIAAAVGLLFSGPRLAAPLAELAFTNLTQYISSHFESLLQSGSLTAADGQPDSHAVTELQKSLDMLEGLGASIQPRSARTIFSFAQPFFPTLNHLCISFHSHPPIVLAVLRIYLSLAATLEYIDDDTADADIASALAEGVWGFFQVLSNDPEVLSLLSREDADATKPYAMLEEALQIVPALAQGAPGGHPSPVASSQDYLLPSFGPTADNGASAQAAVMDLSPTRLEDVTLVSFVTLSKLVEPSALAQAPSLGATYASACVDVVRTGSKRLLGLILASGEGLDVLAAVTQSVAMALAVEDVSSVMIILEAVQSFATTASNVLPLALKPGDRFDALGQIRLVFEGLVMHLLSTILFGPLDPGVMDDYLKALYSLLLVFSKESMGGEAGLLEALQNFAANPPSSDAATAAATSAEVVQAVEQIFLGQKQFRAETYLTATGSSHGSPFRSGHAGSGSGSSNFLRLQSRMRVQASRKAQEAFVRSVQPSVHRARAGVHIR